MYGVGGTDVTAAPAGFGGGGRAGNKNSSQPELENGGPGASGVLYISYYRKVTS